MLPAFRRIAYSAGVLFMIGYGYLVLRGPQGIPTLLEKRREVRALEIQNANLQRENEYRRERIRKLRESSSEQEMEVRKKLKLSRPGEMQFIVPKDTIPPDTHSPAPSPPEPRR